MLLVPLPQVYHLLFCILDRRRIVQLQVIPIFPRLWIRKLRQCLETFHFVAGDSGLVNENYQEGGVRAEDGRERPHRMYHDRRDRPGFLASFMSFARNF